MYIDNLYIGIIFQVLAYFAQKNIHTAAVKVIVIMPDVQQRLFTGKYFVFPKA